MSPSRMLLGVAGLLTVLMLASQPAQADGQEADDGGLGALFTNGLGNAADLFGGALGTKRESKGAYLEKKVNAVEKALEKEEKKSLFEYKDPMEFFKLMLNPAELIDRIVFTFKLEKLEFVETLSKNLVVGVELALQPVVLSAKIIEKVLVPDTCKLKFICEFARPIGVVKGNFIPKFSEGVFDGSSTLRAFADGVAGLECGQKYVCGSGEPKLKDEYKGQKHAEHEEHEHEGSHEYRS